MNTEKIERTELVESDDIELQGRRPWKNGSIELRFVSKKDTRHGPELTFQPDNPNVPDIGFLRLSGTTRVQTIVFYIKVFVYYEGRDDEREKELFRTVIEYHYASVVKGTPLHWYPDYLLESGFKMGHTYHPTTRYCGEKYNADGRHNSTSIHLPFFDRIHSIRLRYGYPQDVGGQCERKNLPPDWPEYPPKKKVDWR